MVRSAIAVISLATALTATAKAETVTFIWHDGIVASRPYYFSQFLPSTNKSVNDSGIVVGATQDPQTYVRTAATWNGGDFTVLGGLSGFPESFASSINNHGSAVGASINAGALEPTAWISGQILDLGIVPGISGPFGITGAFANALNEEDQIVGFQYAASGPIPILWQDGQVNQLSVVPGADTAEPLDINESGIIVGYSGRQPVVWRNGIVSALPACDFGVAYALNDLGQVVGSCGSNAVLWQNGAMTVIGPDLAVGISNNGTVIGRTSDDALQSQTYTWTAAGGLQTLPGFAWSAPFSISSDGAYILGYGEIAPEPSSVGLCAAGLLTIVFLWGRQSKRVSRRPPDL